MPDMVGLDKHRQTLEVIFTKRESDFQGMAKVAVAGRLSATKKRIWLFLSMGSQKTKNLICQKKNSMSSKNCQKFCSDSLRRKLQ